MRMRPRQIVIVTTIQDPTPFVSFSSFCSFLNARRSAGFHLTTRSKHGRPRSEWDRQSSSEWRTLRQSASRSTCRCSAQHWPITISKERRAYGSSTHSRFHSLQHTASMALATLALSVAETDAWPSMVDLIVAILRLTSFDFLQSKQWNNSRYSNYPRKKKLSINVYS